MLQLLKVTSLSIILLTALTQKSLAGDIRDPGATPTTTAPSTPAVPSKVTKLPTRATDESSCAQLVPKGGFFGFDSTTGDCYSIDPGSVACGVDSPAFVGSATSQSDCSSKVDSNHIGFFKESTRECFRIQIPCGVKKY